MKTLLIPILLSISLLLVACRGQGEASKYKAYLYKQASQDGLVCVFYSNIAGVAEQNAHMFSDLHKEKFGVPLIVRKEPF